MSSDFMMLFHRQSRKAIYGDGPPHWTTGKGEKAQPAKSSAEAKARKDKLVARLDRRAKRLEREAHAVRKLSSKLANCRPRNRCESGGCPVCGRALQRTWVKAVGELLATDDRKFMAVSIVPRQGRFTFKGRK